MKKLISLFIALVLVFMVGACSPTSNTDLEDRVEVLEETVVTQQQQIELLNEFYENVVVSTGLNGQKDYYVNHNDSYYLSRVSFDVMNMVSTEKDYLDKTKFPDYIWGTDEEYIDINELGNKLTMKYLGVASTSSGGTYFTIKISDIPSGMSDEEFIVRVSLMLLELAQFDFYTIDTSQVYIEFIAGASKYMLVRTALLIDDSYSLHPAIFWNELLETKIQGLSYDTTNLETMYNDYVTNETFIGYVLPNYN